MRLIKKGETTGENIFPKRKNFKGKEKDGISISRADIILERDRLREASENYRFAPMAVKKYYLSLYYNLLNKYEEELQRSGWSGESDAEYGCISLYQDAGRLFSSLYHGLNHLEHRAAQDAKE